MTTRTDHARVLVTFIGGPLHGEQRELVPEERIFHDGPDGERMLYVRRIMHAQVIDGAHSGWSHIAYAPLGMAEWAFFDLARTLAQDDG